MKLKFKKLAFEAILPSYAKPGDAGLDLTAIGKSVSPLWVEYYTGLAVEIPEGHVGFLFPRSSISNKTLILSNCVGVIDSGYRGEIKARFKTIRDEQQPLFLGENDYEIGDRVVQLIVLPYPKMEVELVEELSSTERGEGGYGSTGT